MDIPESVQQVANENDAEVSRQVTCRFCNTELYELERDGYRLFVTKQGKLPEDYRTPDESDWSTTFGAISIEDTGAYPALLADDGSSYLCDACKSVDSFERGTVIVGVPSYSRSMSDDIAHFLRDGVLDSHYLDDWDSTWKGTSFEETYKRFANDETPVVEYGTEEETLVRPSEEFINKSPANSEQELAQMVRNHEVEYDFPVVFFGFSGRKLFIPKSEN